MPDGRKAVAAANDSGKPIFIFCGCCCGPCKTLGQTQMVDPCGCHAMRDVIPLFVDFDNGLQNLADKYNAGARPTLILADQGGKEIKRYTGAQQVPKLKEVIPGFAKKILPRVPVGRVARQGFRTGQNREAGRNLLRRRHDGNERLH